MTYSKSIPKGGGDQTPIATSPRRTSPQMQQASVDPPGFFVVKTWLKGPKEVWISYLPGIYRHQSSLFYRFLWCSPGYRSFDPLPYDPSNTAIFLGFSAFQLLSLGRKSHQALWKTPRGRAASSLGLEERTLLGLHGADRQVEALRSSVSYRGPSKKVGTAGVFGRLSIIWREVKYLLRYLEKDAFLGSFLLHHPLSVAFRSFMDCYSFFWTCKFGAVWLMQCFLKKNVSFVYQQLDSHSNI